MLESLRSGLCLAAFGTVALSATSSAQLVQNSSAFVLESFSRDAGGLYHYSYRLSNPTAREVFSDILVDVYSPPSQTRSKLLAHSGTFILDATDDPENAARVSRPAIGIASPKMWSAAIYFNADLSWGATRYYRSENYGVAPKKALRGFALKSPALPAFRQFQVIPYRPFEQEGAPIKTDSTWMILTGYVLAPGWMASEVNALYVKEMVEGACWYRVFNDCRGYRNAAAALLSSAEAGNRQKYQTFLNLLVQRINSDRTLTPMGAAVLKPALTALVNRGSAGMQVFAQTPLGR